MRGKGQTTSTDARSSWLRRLSRACWRYPRNLTLALAGTLVVSLVGIAIPLIQRAIVDNLTSAAQPAIWPLAAALLVAAAANFAGLYVRRYRGGRLSLDVQHDLRTRLFSALSRLDGTRQDELHTGQIVSRSISDLTMIQSLLSMVPMLMGNAVLFVGSMIAMAFLSPVLTLVALAVGPALWFIAAASRRTLFPASWDAQQQAAGIAAVVDEAVTGVRVVKGFGQEEQEVQRIERASTRVFEVIDARPVVTDRPDAHPLPPGIPDVELDDVRFGYVPSQPVLRGLSLRATPGETLALVGPAGSGKSSISLLLPRFYDVSAGALRVGARNVREITQDSLRYAIGLVMEDSFLFSDTVAANIAFGRPDATREQVVAAARAAEADGFIAALPQGYDTVVGEKGLTLSGGQR